MYVDSEGKALWDEVTKDIRAQLSTQQKRPRNAFSVYLDSGELLYWMHPRDAFIAKMVFLHNCHGLKNVSKGAPFYCGFRFLATAQSPAVEHARDLVAQIPDWLDAHDENPKARIREKKDSGNNNQRDESPRCPTRTKKHERVPY